MVTTSSAGTGRLDGVGVWDAGGWLTPFGTVPVDDDLAMAILGLGRPFTTDRAAHRGEHSLEVQLPFVRVVAPDARLVPLAIAAGTSWTAQAAGDRLGRLLAARRAGGERMALVISTDAAHYPEDRIARAVNERLTAALEAGDAAELAQVRLELEEGGLLPTPSARRRPARTEGPEAGVRRGETPGGYSIAWGKNNRSNDHVSRQLTAEGDWWFHAHDLPGCHLVLKTSGRPSAVPETDLLYAAAVAAGYSRGKGSDKVEVIIAPGKAVRKPKGARPGLVVVERFRTVVVRPLRPQ